MSFTLSGTTITQSGTDTDLSGLIGIAGVTIQDGTYTIDGLRLEITGDLTFNALDERIAVINYAGLPATNGYRGAVVVRSGGVWTNTSQRRGVYVPTKVLQVSPFDAVFTGSPLGQSNQGGRSAFSVEQGATANMQGIFETQVSDNGAGIVFELNGTVNCEDVIFLNKRDDAANLNHQLAFTLGADNINFNRVQIYGMNIVDRGAAIISQFNEVEVDGALEAYNIGGNTVSGIASRFFLVPNFTFGNSSEQDVRTNANGGETIHTEFRDSNRGNSIVVSISDDISQNIRTWSSATLNMEFLDDSLLPVDATYYAIDVDNGNRQADFTPAGQPTVASSGNFVYTDTAISGQAQEVVINQIVGPDDTAAFIDNRGVSNGADLLWRAIAYNNNISTFQPSLEGLGEKSTTSILPKDNLITESDKSTVDAYTTQETASKAYDHLKSILVDNYTGESETIVTRSGDTLDVRGLDVTIDGTGSGSATLVGNVLTLNASTFTGNITTTGTVTLNNGSTVSGSIFDATQDSSILEANGATFTVYANEANRDSRTNPIVSDVTSYSFLFANIPANPLYLWVVSGATELPTTVTAVQGVNEFDLGTAGVLNTLSNLIQYIPSKIYVDVTATENGTGTEVSPFNNITSAIENSANLGTRTIVFMTDTVLDQNLSDFKIEGTPKSSVVTLNNRDVINCTFSGLKLTGTAGENSDFNANKCTLIDIYNLNGTYTTCFIENIIKPMDNGSVNMVNITSAEPADERPTLDFSGDTGVSCVLRDYRGGLNITGMEDAEDKVTISGTECKYTLDATNTEGNISLRGIGQLTDNSNGLTVDTTALNNPEQIGIAVGQIISNVDVPTSTRATQVSVDALNNFDPTTDQVIVATNNDKTDYELANNAITSNKVATGAFNNSSFTTGYFNSINSEVDTALNDYDAPTKAELDTAQASIESAITAIPSTDISSLETKAQADARQVLLIAEHNDTQTAISNISFDDTDILNAISSLNDISVTDIDNSSILAKEATLNSIVSSIANIPTTDSVADLTPVLTALSNLNDPTVAQIRAGFNEADFKDKNIESEIHAWLDSYTNKDDFKADSTDLTTVLNNQNIINEGVKLASLIIPHDTNL